MICVSVANRPGLEDALHSGAGLIELRLDLIKEQPAILYPLIPKSVRTIVTCRHGEYDDFERVDLLKSGIELGADYVDLEIETPAEYLKEICNVAAKRGTSVIISYHDFERTADREDLESVMIACYEKGGQIAKIATQVNAPDDIRNLLSLYDLPGKKVILGMGSLGRITRLVGPYLGAEFTFASAGVGGETASGQFTVKQLNDIYKVIDNS
jgi:3-dehydroquinate dehydratase type I